MRALLEQIGISSKRLDYSSVMVVYQTGEHSWRGFVVPFDITFEAETKREVVSALRDMIDSYVDGLHQYHNPAHLENVPLSYEPDRQKWFAISQGLIVKLMNKVREVDTPDYYAEAQLPA